MISTNTNWYAKIAAVVAGSALVLSSFAFAAPARAQTSAELQAQISALLAQIAALQAQLQGGGSVVTAAFTRDLTIGATGADVTQLQNWLISKGYSIPAGATGYFGTQTRAAVAAYQAANAISPAAGYFGPITRAHVNAQLGGGTTTPPPSGGDDDDLRGGEASLERLRASEIEDQIEEGATEEVGEFEFRVEDGDIRIDRLDLSFETGATGGEEDEPWETFETIRILDEDGDELAEEDVSDEDDWLRDDSPYVFRFTGLNYIVREGDTGTLIVEIETQSGIDGAENTIPWTMYIDDRGLRGIDGEGIQQYLGDDSETVEFDIVEEGEGDELSVRRSSEDPDSTTLQVDEDRRSDWHTVFVFDLEADDDSNDIELDTIGIDFLTGTSDVEDVINDVELVIDGETFDDFDWTNGDSTFASTTFDIDGDYTVEAGERVEVEVRVQFRAASGFTDNETIRASVRGENVHAEGADDLTADGNVSGDTHTLSATGISVTKIEDDARVTVIDGNDNDFATFEIEVEIEAFEQDVYISRTGSSAFNFVIEDSAGDEVADSDTATSTTVSSSADVEGNFYVVDEGDVETFTFRVVYNPAAGLEGDSFRMQLESIIFGDDTTLGDADDTTWTAAPASLYETDFVFIAD